MSAGEWFRLAFIAAAVVVIGIITFLFVGGIR
jgi:hypothetical protein